MNKIKGTIAVVAITGILLGALTLSTGIGSVDTGMAPNENFEQIGILVVAHGSPEERWCKPVREAVENVSLPYPVELGFLEFVPNETITTAVERFNERGITKIIAVPLFISSYSDHIPKIEYVLGVRDNPPEGAGNLTQVDTNATIVFTKAIDDHVLIAYTLADRVAELSKDPDNETVVIVGEGTDNETDFMGWNNSLATNIPDNIRMILKYYMEPTIRIREVKYAFIRVNETLHSDLTLRAVVENASIENDVIVVPLMISEDFFTEKYIPQLLENLSYAYSGKTLAPHPNVARWIETSVRCAIGDEKYGLLVIDHGSKGLERVNVVRELMKEVKLDVPVALAFAEHPPENESINAGVDKLLQQGVNHVIVVTLFTEPTPDHDEAVEEVYEALKTSEQTKILQNVTKHMGIRITVAGPIDDNPLIAGLILDRAREVSEEEDEEILVISRWGSLTYFEHGEIYARSLAEQVKAISNFKDVRYGFMQYQGSPNIRQVVEEAAHDGPVIVVTTNSLGSSYVDELIAKKLKGLNYRYNGKGFYGYPEELSQHPNIARWIELTATKQMRKDTPNQGVFATGFEAVFAIEVFAIASLLAIAYLVLRVRR